jgi:hypothetical protein
MLSVKFVVGAVLAVLGSMATLVGVPLIFGNSIIVPTSEDYDPVWAYYAVGTIMTLGGTMLQAYIYYHYARSKGRGGQWAIASIVPFWGPIALWLASDLSDYVVIQDAYGELDREIEKVKEEIQRYRGQ